MIKLNHIGIAVNDLPQMRKLFAVLGLSVTHTEDVADQGVRTHFFPVQGLDTQIELLEVMDPKGTVAKFIQKRGPGVHHLSFQVSKGELYPLCSKLVQEGYRLIYESPQKGAHEMMINFIHPSTCGGVLVELMEKV